MTSATPEKRNIQPNLHGWFYVKGNLNNTHTMTLADFPGAKKIIDAIPINKAVDATAVTAQTAISNTVAANGESIVFRGYLFNPAGPNLAVSSADNPFAALVLCQIAPT